MFKSNLITNPFYHYTFDNFFTDREMDLVLKETQLLSYSCSQDQSLLLSGFDHSKNKSLAKRHGISLQHFYTDPWKQSVTYNIIKKLYFLELEDCFSKDNFIKNFLKSSNRDDTLVSFYKHGDYYDTHRDNSTLTFIVYLTDDTLDSGNLIFPEFNNFTFKAVNNSAILFPSYLLHQVQHVLCTKSNFCRVSFSMFIKVL